MFRESSRLDSRKLKNQKMGRGHKEAFYRRRHMIANKHIKRHPTSLAFREM